MLIINSFPKSGTNLVKTMLDPVGNFIGHMSMYDGRSGLPFPSELIENTLAQMPVDWLNFATMHLHWHPRFAEIIEQGKWKMILLVRDLKDVIVSHAFYVNATPDHSLYPYYNGFSGEHQIWLSMKGLREAHLPDIGNRFLPYVGWQHYPFVMVMTFEQIIADPTEAAMTILEFWQGNPNHGLAAKMARNIQDGSDTYRKGIVGDWKNVFTQDQAEYFKEHFSWAHYLIERNV